MDDNRRTFLGTAAIGMGGLLALTGTATAGGIETDKGQPGAGGFGLKSQQLPPGATVAYHDPDDIKAMPAFTRSLDGSRPKVTSGGWAKESTEHQLPIMKGLAGVHMLLDPGASPKEMLGENFGISPALFDSFPKGETYIQAGPVVPIAEAIDAPWPRESTHKFSLAHDPRARRDFDGGSFSLATVDEWPISTTMSGGLMTIRPGQMKELHWNPNADEFHFYLSGTGKVAMFGSGGRGQLADVKAGDSAYIPQGYGHGIMNTGSDDLQIVQTWNSGKFEEITLKRWMQTAPRYLLSNNMAGVPASTLDKIQNA